MAAACLVSRIQRLDWWPSGLSNGLFISAVIFLLASLVRRLRSPNPLVDLPYLQQWNTIVLGEALGFFRFCLLATIILSQFLIAFIAALLLLHGLDSRLLMATGFTCIAVACILNAQYTFA